MEIWNFNEVCRLCLLKTNLLKLIKETSNEISFKINEFIQISALKDEGFEKMNQLPDKICEMCEEHLFKFCEFTKTILNNQVVLKELLFKKDFGNYSETLIHKDEYSKVINSEISNKKIESIEISNSETLKKKTPNVKKNILNRKRNYSSKSHKCNTCEKSFHRKDHLIAHIRTHTGERPFSCDMCGQSFKQQGSLKNHKLLHENSNDRPHMCSKCGFRFKQAASLKTHMMIHNSEFQYKCKHCDKGFIQSSNFKRHLQLHEKIREYKFHCDICNKKYISKSSLKDHLRRHRNQKSYKCNLCPKAFFTASNLSEHKKRHQTSQFYWCDVK